VPGGPAPVRPPAVLAGHRHAGDPVRFHRRDAI